MIRAVAHTSLWVTDQDEALSFYTEKVGFELREDVTVPEFGSFRWLTVGVPGQATPEVILVDPSFLPLPPEGIAKVKEMVAEGNAGGGMILAVDDVKATFEELKGRGVEFVQEPVEQFYGWDAAFRDPFGNQIRIGNRTDR